MALDIAMLHKQILAAKQRMARKTESRYIGPVEGCYTLSDHRDPDGHLDVFACRTQSISSASVAVVAPVCGAEGEWLTAKFEGLGIIRGWIERRTPDGFVFRISATEEERRKLAARIEWLKGRALHKQSNKRQFRRFLVRDPKATMRLADGSLVGCFIVDLSCGGAAISGRIRPDVGDRVVLGSLPGRVVRHVNTGFAIQFDQVQEREGLEQKVVHPAPAPTAS